MPTPTPRHTPAVQDQPYVEVFTEIGAIEHYLRAAVTKHLPEGMTHAQFEMLQWFLRYGDGQTPAELARMMLLTKGAITNILHKLEKMGFVVVLADCDDYPLHVHLHLLCSGLDDADIGLMRNQPIYVGLLQLVGL